MIHGLLPAAKLSADFSVYSETKNQVISLIQTIFALKLPPEALQGGALSIHFNQFPKEPFEVTIQDMLIPSKEPYFQHSYEPLDVCSSLECHFKCLIPNIEHAQDGRV